MCFEMMTVFKARYWNLSSLQH